MILITNWKKVLMKAWSVRLIILAALLSGVEVALPLFETALPRGIFAAISGLVTAGALVARIIAQTGINES